jgi:aminocarboxymuconate-semialdehyde decarboxylase
VAPRGYRFTAAVSAFPWNRVPVDHIMSIPGLSDEDRIAILGGTTAKLLGINP